MYCLSVRASNYYVINGFESFPDCTGTFIAIEQTTYDHLSEFYTDKLSVYPMCGNPAPVSSPTSYNVPANALTRETCNGHIILSKIKYDEIYGEYVNLDEDYANQQSQGGTQEQVNQPADPVDYNTLFDQASFDASFTFGFMSIVTLAAVAYKVRVAKSQVRQA